MAMIKSAARRIKALKSLSMITGRVSSVVFSKLNPDDMQETFYILNVHKDKDDHSDAGTVSVKGNAYGKISVGSIIQAGGVWTEYRGKSATGRQRWRHR